MGWRFFVSPRVPDALNEKHYELIENCAEDQRRKSKSSPLQQQRHVWCHYTEHRPDFTKHRIRMSLGTPSLPAARAKRDRWFSAFVPVTTTTGRHRAPSATDAAIGPL